MTVRTVRLYAAALAALLSLSAPTAFGLDSIGEQFGNTPIAGGPGLPFGLLSILNDTHRVYLFNIASDGYKSYVAGYFQGDTAAANDALRRFAALEKGLDVVLLPGPREVAGFDAKRKVSTDWELHIPMTRAGARPRLRSSRRNRPFTSTSAFPPGPPHRPPPSRWSAGWRRWMPKRSRTASAPPSNWRSRARP